MPWGWTLNSKRSPLLRTRRWLFSRWANLLSAGTRASQILLETANPGQLLWKSRDKQHELQQMARRQLGAGQRATLNTHALALLYLGRIDEARPLAAKKNLPAL